MAYSDMLKLTLALQKSLVDQLPSLVAEVNANVLDPLGNPYVSIVLPIPAVGSTSIVALGIRTAMLQRPLNELPVASCGVYLRTPIHEGEQQFSEFAFPFTIDIYTGGKNADDLYVQALKWGILLDLWQERFGSNLVYGFTSAEAPDLDISYALELRGNEFRQLITATGVFTTHE